MVNLIGSLPGGQHTATILSNEDNTWYEFHDEQVKKVSRIILDVKNMQKIPQPHSTVNGDILFSLVFLYQDVHVYFCCKF